MRRCVYNVDVNFFKIWNSKMAYVLGLTFSDGNIYKTTLSWQLQMRDKELLFRTRNAMKSNYPIEFSIKKNAVRLRISNPLLIESLKQFGLIPNKSKFPSVPSRFLRDFIRGFLDGDGWIISGKRKNEICVGFASHDRKFLEELVRHLNGHVPLTSNNLRAKEKVTKKGKISVLHQIEWYGTNAFNIIKFLYNDLKNDDLYLERKYKLQLEARKFYAESKKGRRWKEVERKYNMPMEKLLSRLFIDKKLNGVQIAEILGISSAATYRWLEKTKLRIPAKKKPIFMKCLICGKEFKRRNSKQKYCSLSCAGKGLRTGKIVNCSTCSKGIYRPKWWFGVNNIPFCSRKCQAGWHSQRMRAGVIPRCPETGRFLPIATYGPEKADHLGAVI